MKDAQHNEKGILKGLGDLVGLFSGDFFTTSESSESAFQHGNVGNSNFWKKKRRNVGLNLAPTTLQPMNETNRLKGGVYGVFILWNEGLERRPTATL